MEAQPKQVEAIPVLSRRERLTIPQIPSHSGPAIQSLKDEMKRHGLKSAGGGIIYIYHGCNGDPTVPFDLEICIPVQPGLNVKVDRPLELKAAPPFQCMAMDHIGPMTQIGVTWMKLVGAVRASGRQPTEESREIYKHWVDFNSAENITELQQGIT